MLAIELVVTNEDVPNLPLFPLLKTFNKRKSSKFATYLFSKYIVSLSTSE